MKRSDKARPAKHNPRRGRLALVGIAATLALTACGRAIPASGDITPGAAKGEAIVVIALDDEFAPAVLELEPGTQVTIEINNQGERAHNMVIDELDLSTGTLEPGDLATATFTVPEAHITFYCSFHPGMEGELRPATG